MSEPAASVRHFLVIGLVAALAFVGGAYMALNNRSAQAPDIPGLLWPDSAVIGHFELTNMHGVPLTEDWLRKHWTLVFFGFTHCPDICPTTLATLKSVVATLKDVAPFASRQQVLFVSVDPARDKPAILKDYVTYFDSSFMAATGDDRALATITRQFSAIYTKVTGGTADNYNVDHTATVFLVDPALKLVGAFSPPHEPAALSQHIRDTVNFLVSQSK